MKTKYLTVWPPRPGGPGVGPAPSIRPLAGGAWPARPPPCLDQEVVPPRRHEHPTGPVRAFRPRDSTFQQLSKVTCPRSQGNMAQLPCQALAASTRCGQSPGLGHRDPQSQLVLRGFLMGTGHLGPVEPHSCGQRLGSPLPSHVPGTDHP